MHAPVPTLEALEGYTDAELMKCRTVLVDALAGLRGALETSERALTDPDWVRRARGSMKIHERGLGNIRNLLQERASTGRFNALCELARAVGDFLDEDSDENFEALEAAYRTAWAHEAANAA